MSMHCNDHVSCLARFVKLSRRKERRTCLEHLITLCVAKLRLKFHRVPYTAPREGVTCFRASLVTKSRDPAIFPHILGLYLWWQVLRQNLIEEYQWQVSRLALFQALPGHRDVPGSTLLIGKLRPRTIRRLAQSSHRDRRWDI